MSENRPAKVVSFTSYLPACYVQPFGIVLFLLVAPDYKQETVSYAPRTHIVGANLAELFLLLAAHVNDGCVK